MYEICKITLLSILSIGPAPLAAELSLAQGQRGAWLEGAIGDYQLVVDCTANWGSQGLANFMLGPQAEVVDPNLKDVTEFRYQFEFDGDFPLELESGSTSWITVDVDEFNDRLFWNVPISDMLASQFSYSKSLTFKFNAGTGPQTMTLVMDRPEDMLVGRTGMAWIGFYEICKEEM